MRKGLLFWMLQLFLGAHLFAQRAAVPQTQSGTAGFVQNNFEGNVEVFDANGSVFVNDALDVTGSPYFTNDWKYGYILMNDNKRFGNIQFRLNLKTQQIHYLARNNNAEMFIPSGMVKEVVLLTDSSRTAAMLADFQCGFPAIDGQSPTSFYQVLSRGKITLLLFTQKNIAEEKDEFSGEVKKRYVNFVSYYVFAQNSLQKARKDKPFLLNLTSDKKDKMEAFINDNNLKLKSFDDLKKSIDYYNTLP